MYFETILALCEHFCENNFFLTFIRAKKGRAPCTWQPFMDASHALRSSSKTVISTFFFILFSALNVYLILFPSSLRFYQVGKLTVWINMAIPPSTLLLSTAMNCWSALWWPTEQTQPGRGENLTALTFRKQTFIDLFGVQHLMQLLTNLFCFSDVGSMECSPCT